MKSGTRWCNPVHSKEKSDLESRTFINLTCVLKLSLFSALDTSSYVAIFVASLLAPHTLLANTD
jgi:hypothetical protein